MVPNRRRLAFGLILIVLSSFARTYSSPTTVRVVRIGEISWWLVDKPVRYQEYLESWLIPSAKSLHALRVSDGGFGAGFGTSYIQSRQVRPDGARLVLVGIGQNDVDEFVLLLVSSRGARELWRDTSRGRFRLLERPNHAYALEETWGAADAFHWGQRSGENGFRKTGANLKRTVFLFKP